MFRRKDKKEPLHLREIRYAVGVRSYYGAKDITYILFALIIAQKAVMNSSKSQQRFFHELACEWSRLIRMNREFMNDMEVLNDDIF